MSSCPNGSTAILNVFGDCVDTPLKWCGWVVGMASNVVFAIVIIPQVVENYKLKQCKGISLFFLIIWGIGDLCNIIGCFLADQLSVQKILGFLYLIAVCF
ncbi:hypothetical protein AB6A40_008945 [Gnathostoma spinigerum]|uniref:Uncharacterized protein n=1 Tax=Gnathostoma spinigerum TaxID=75299 RepID=A0ABD6EQW2_9BILA